MTGKTKIPWQKLTVISVLSGIIYNSWPLGYWLNPVAAREGLGSELQGLHQPYNWVFIAGDVISSLLIAIVAWWLWRLLRGHTRQAVFKTMLLNIGGFSLFTAVAAVVQVRCDASLRQCPNFMHDPVLLVHGVSSVVASLCLFVSLLLIWWLDRRSRLLQVLLVGYVIFGMISFVDLFVSGQSNVPQHYYITLCSLWLAVLPYCVWRVVRPGRDAKLKKQGSV